MLPAFSTPQCAGPSSKEMATEPNAQQYQQQRLKSQIRLCIQITSTEERKEWKYLKKWKNGNKRNREKNVKNNEKYLQYCKWMEIKALDILGQLLELEVIKMPTSTVSTHIFRIALVWYTQTYCIFSAQVVLYGLISRFSFAPASASSPCSARNILYRAIFCLPLCMGLNNRGWR